VKPESNSNDDDSKPEDKTPPAGSSQGDAPPPDKGDGKPEETKPAKRRLFGEMGVKGFIELIFAAALVGSALFTNLQTERIIREGDEDAKEQRDRLRVEQRAWIGITNMRTDAQFSLTEPFKVIATITNTGRTPAVDGYGHAEGTAEEGSACVHNVVSSGR